MKGRLLAGLLTFILVATAVSGAWAAIPTYINYQGQLTDASGDPVADGRHLIKFVIYDSATDGTDLWNSEYQSVTITDGTFNIELGTPPMPALPDGIFDGSTDLYLGVTVGVDPEMTPRTRLNSTTAAYKALRADTAALAIEVPNYSIVREKIAINAVGSPQIGNGAVTDQDIAQDAVNSGHVIDNSVGSVDLVDEPGISSAYESSYITLAIGDSVFTVLGTVVIDCPSSGFVVVIASCTWRPIHVNGTRDLARFIISTEPDVLGFSRNQMATAPANDETDPDRPMPVAHHVVFDVTAGSHTFYYTANQFSGAGEVDEARITAMYFPTNYGPVESAPVIEQDDVQLTPFLSQPSSNSNASNER